jgi:hypothetical protein
VRPQGQIDGVVVVPPVDDQAGLLIVERGRAPAQPGALLDSPPGVYTAGTPPRTSRVRSGCLAQPRRRSAMASIKFASAGSTTPPERMA